jgi:hypothetical protein
MGDTCLTNGNFFLSAALIAQARPERQRRRPFHRGLKHRRP